MEHPWRTDPRLQGRFSPEFPDDLQAIIHDGGPRFSSLAPEVAWLRIEATRGLAFEGRLLNVPHALQSVRQGDSVLFLPAEGAGFPIQTSEKYLNERENWDVEPCNGCGLSELFDAPSDLIRRLFPDAPPSAAVEMFTSFCPLCGGVQGITARAQSAPLRPWWKKWSR